MNPTSYLLGSRFACAQPWSFPPNCALKMQEIHQLFFGLRLVSKEFQHPAIQTKIEEHFGRFFHQIKVRQPIERPVFYVCKPWSEQAGGWIHFCMKRLRTFKSVLIFKSEIKKSKTYGSWCPFQGLSSNGTTLMLWLEFRGRLNFSFSCDLGNISRQKSSQTELVTKNQKRSARFQFIGIGQDCATLPSFLFSSSLHHQSSVFHFIYHLYVTGQVSMPVSLHPVISSLIFSQWVYRNIIIISALNHICQGQADFSKKIYSPLSLVKAFHIVPPTSEWAV